MPTTASGAAPVREGPRSRARQLREFFTRRLEGRLIAIGAAVKALYLAVDLAGGPTEGVVRVLSTLGGITLAAGLGIVLYHAVRNARRHLLWSVRRKLIISYVFIGVVPAILIAAFFLLAGLLLFANLGSFMIRASLREMAADAQTIARTTAGEMERAAARRGGGDESDEMAERMADMRVRYPGLGVATVPAAPGRCPAPAAAGAGAGRIVRAARAWGNWSHVPPPAEIPAWVTCDGFSGLLAFLRGADGGAVPPAGDGVVAAVRAVAFTRDVAVVVDLPVDRTVRQRLEAVTGVSVGGFLLGLDGGSAALVEHPPSGSDIASRFPRKTWIALLDYVDWTTGAVEVLQVSVTLGFGDMYQRLSASQASLGSRSFGDLLVIFLLALAGLFLIIQVGALAMGFALARSITGSIDELFAGTERVRRGDFGHRIAVRVKDQLGELGDSFNLMTGSIEDLLRQAAEKKRLEEEMRLAREIQTSLLPPGPLCVPGMTVSALCVPAREVGGDYYDVLPLEGGRVGMLIADVSGKGMSAALYMAELKGLMLSLTRIHQSPRDLLIEANRLIAEHLDSRSFITMTYGVIDPVARTMRYARAGHTPLIYVPFSNGGDSRAAVLAPDGMVVGLRIDNGERFESILEEATLALSPGDVLAFFTDGISEAMDQDLECFGEARLAQLIETHANGPFDDLRERVLREIEAFVGDAPQHDDMTMILLKVDPAA